jgi:hypothetical protein
VKSDEIRAILADTLKEELGPFKVDAKQHAEDHEWTLDTRSWLKTVKKTALTTAVRLGVAGIIGAIIAGIAIGWGGAP